MVTKHIKRWFTSLVQEKCKLKEEDTTTCLIEWPKCRTLTQQILVKTQSNRNSHSLLVETQNGTATLKDSMWFFTILNIFTT